MAKLRIAIFIIFLCSYTQAAARFVEADPWLDEVRKNAAEKSVNEWDSMKANVSKKVSGWWDSIQKKVDDYRGDSKTEKPERTPAVALTPAEPTTEEQVAELKKELPEYKSTERNVYKNIIDDAKNTVSNTNVIQESSPGRKGSMENVRKLKSGVPKFSFFSKKRIKTKKGKTKLVRIYKKHIPLLDIGEEAQISRNELIPPEMKVAEDKYTLPTPLKSPAFVSRTTLKKWTKKKIATVKAPNFKKEAVGLGKVITQYKVDQVQYTIDLTNENIELQPVEILDKEELKMVRGLILYNKKKCHAAVGIFHDMEKVSQYKEESNFFLGHCAHQMGFHSEAVNRLLKVIKGENPEYTSDAIDYIVDQLPKEFEIKVGNTLERIKNKSLIRAKTLARVNYILSKSNYRQRQFVQAEGFAKKVPASSDYYPDAQYMAAISQYSQGMQTRSITTLEATRKWMEANNKSDDNIETLIAINLGRMKFRKSKYKQALNDYLKIKKNHPLWVQGLTEQGWTQLQVGDYSGAIGNMYSLHSPYFKVVYKPESYAVRTIGYINICQYGDAYRTLSRLEGQHRTWLSSVDRFIKSKKKARNYYNTVADYVRGKSDQSVNGLPYQVIREIARQRDFLNAQESLNNKEDELNQYRFIYGIIKKDQANLRWKIKKASERIAVHRANLKKLKEDKTLIKFKSEWRAGIRNEQSLIAGIKFELKAIEEGRRGYLRMRRVARKRIAGEKYRLKEKAGRALVKHLSKMKTQMAKVIENNEFLRYEIYSGSGENIRYQVAGGKTSKAQRVPANVKPTKILNWDFEGEYWEDEIGSYRSSLHNNCPKYGSIQGTKFKPKRK